MDLSANRAYQQFFEDGPYALDHACIHEPDYRVLARLKIGRPIVFDVGANKGQSIAAFLTLLSDPIIHAFECHPAMISVLNNLIRVRRVRCARVTVHPFGLSDSEDSIGFTTPIVDEVIHFEETTLSPEVEFRKHAHRYVGEGRTFATFSFEAMVRRGDNLGIVPDFVKIDAEGAEPNVVRGMAATIEDSKPHILAETSCFTEVNDLLLPMGYAVYQASGETLVPLSEGRANVFYVHPSRRGDFLDGTFAG